MPTLKERLLSSIKKFGNGQRSSDRPKNTPKPEIRSDFVIRGDIMTDYTGAAPEIFVPLNVKEIRSEKADGKGCFDSRIVRVNLPSALKVIGPNAFAGCFRMPDVFFPQGLEEIGSGAFCGCTKLRSLHFPDSVRFLGPGAFQRCSSLKTVRIPRPVSGCADGETLTEGTISAGLFKGCRYLQSAILPEGIKIIGQGAFQNCGILTSVVIPEGVTEIGASAFEGCCLLKEIRLPSTLKIIGAAAFKSCRALESVVIPEGVTVLGAEAFAKCAKLKKVSLPGSLTELSADVFSGCTELDSLHLPARITALDPGCFPHGETGVVTKPAKFRAVTADPENPKYRSENGILFSKDGSSLILCPAQYGSEEYSVPEGVTEICPRAFEGCRNIRKLRLPSSVTVIGERAFAYMADLEEVIFPAAMESLGSSLFFRCRNLKTVCWPKDLKSIGERCFFETGIEEPALPPTLEQIGESAFAHIGAKKIPLPPSVRKIGEGAFIGVPLIEVRDDANPVGLGSAGVWVVRDFPDWRTHAVSVRSAETGAVKYTIHMPTRQRPAVRAAFASAWEGADFRFETVDAVFDDMTADGKYTYLLDRLRCPKDIAGELPDSIRACIVRDAKAIFARILKTDAVEELVLLEPCGIVTPDTLSERFEQVNGTDAVECKAWLMDWNHRRSSSGEADYSGLSAEFDLN